MYSIYDLAAHPEHLQPLRQEIETVIKEEGWSKAAVAKMSKLDSFIKETMRLTQIVACTYTVFRLLYTLTTLLSAVTMERKTMKDFTFSDGTIIPAGNFIAVPASCIHTDPVNILYHILHLNLPM